jgi:hypothetical protein
MNEARPSNWIDEQAAEYQDLVGSFVESVVDKDTDEIIEYQLIWEGGDLGVALTTKENELGVCVSRVTGKGFPFGIKNVGSGDSLLSINMEDMTKNSLEQVVKFLQECDLPATLRFKKSEKRPSVTIPPPVRSNPSGVTSPTGSSAPRSSTRGSSKKSNKKRSSPQNNSRASLLTTGDRLSNTSSVQSRPSDGYRASNDSAVRASETRISDGTVGYRPTENITAQGSESQSQRASDSTVGYRASENSTVRGSDSQRPSDSTTGYRPSDNSQRLSVATSVASVGSPVQSSLTAPPPPPAKLADSMLKLSVQGDDVDEEEVADQVRELAPVKTKKKGKIATKLEATFVPVLGNDSIVSQNIPVIPRVDSMVSNVSSVDALGSQLPVSTEQFLSDDEDEEANSPVSHQVQPMVLEISPNEDKVQSSMTMSMKEDLLKSQPMSELHQMCAKGNVRGVVQYVKVKGFEGFIDREANHGQTCLHLAAKSGSAPLIKFILEQFKPLEDLINLEDDKGNNALHFAATKTPHVVHMLLECGAIADVKNSRALSPLIISIITSKDDNVIVPRMLLKFGGNANDMHEGHTVIHTAVSRGMFHIAGALVKAGAKMDVEDSEGKNIFEKVNRKSLRFLLSHIHFPPTAITEKERPNCMLCQKKFGFGTRKCNCTHCGRIACHDCASLNVEMYKLPMGFPGRVKRGAAVRDLKRVCKTCYSVFKERNDVPVKEESRFMKRIVGVEWDEVNPNKLQPTRAAGRRGEKE